MKNYLLYISLVACGDGIFCQPLAPHQIHSNLTRISRHSNAEILPLDQAFVSTLEHSGVSGGMEISSCEYKYPLVSLAQEAQVIESIEKIRGFRPELAIDRSEAELVNLIERGRMTDLLDTQIQFLQINNPVSPASVLHQILAAPSVRQRIVALKLEIGQVQLGFGRMPKSGPEEEVPPLVVRNLTVRQVLNKVALLGRHRIWLYRESICGDQRSIQLSFPLW